MTVSATQLRALAGLGLSSDQIIGVVAVMEMRDEARDAKRDAPLTPAERSKRYRDNKRHESRDGLPVTSGVTAAPPSAPSSPSSSPLTLPLITTPPSSPTPPVLRTAAGAAPEGMAGPTQAELEREFYRRGKQVCGKNAGGMLTGLLKSREFDIALARGVVEVAATKQDPREYVAGAIRAGPGRQNAGFQPRPGSKDDTRERTVNAIRKLSEYADAHADDKERSGSTRDEAPGLLRLAQSPRS